ncbi:hypothetical protein J6W34_05365 [bacterium]|nr:hypothetical protein [bacterium]
MKFNKKAKYLLVGFSIIGALAIIAGSTAAVTIHSNQKSLTKSPTKASSDNNNNSNSTKSNPSSNSGIGKTNSNSSGNNNGSNSKNTTNGEPNKNGTGSKSGNSTPNSGSTGTKTGNSGSTQTNPKNTQPEPSPTNTGENEGIANTLDSLLNNYINVANYDSMNTLTAAQALNKPNALTYAIKQAILNQISQSTFEVDGNSYKTLEIVNNINVKLPNINSLNSNYSIQIQPVTLSYNGISLKTSDADSTFTIIGFKQSSYETYMENSILN